MIEETTGNSNPSNEVSSEDAQKGVFDSSDSFFDALDNEVSGGVLDSKNIVERLNTGLRVLDGYINGFFDEFFDLVSANKLYNGYKNKNSKIKFYKDLLDNLFK